ncbi:DoxX family protein [Gimesia aquarii]|uniref:DoxX n=1 Tax=Gimesia aquarii TaxID=2527964 RepID=A0A517WXV4_9PLAN|nr:DoxX family protein [Gimesia aquarii]QDU10062.1 hypothetical protein V202x_34600 [Gimesia aquarii]
MNQSEVKPTSTAQTVMIWIGRVVSVLVALAFGMSAMMKLKGGPEFAEGMEKLGLPESMILPLAILEIFCVLLYLIPWTAVLGAILLTGYMGGAICTHWRVGDPFMIQVAIGVLIWLGLYLREKRLWGVLPIRKMT